jgi:hypothetical protein
MPLPLPNLDDRSYADLVEEAIARIPVEAPEWTDHNPADTGIVLIELLAWLTEMVLYRVNQVSEQHQAAFLTLLKGQPWRLPEGVSSSEGRLILQAEIQRTLVQLRRPYRAVTLGDFEQLILSDWPQTRTAQTVFGEAGVIARVNCLPERDLEHADIHQVVEAHISLVVLPRLPSSNSEPLRQTLKRFLNQRRLLTTHLHVVEPSYIQVTLGATLYLQDTANFRTVQALVAERVHTFFSPLDSGVYWQGAGYPFGANVYLSEMYQLLDNLPGVDYVETLTLTTPDTSRQLYNDRHELVGLTVYPHELVEIAIGQLLTMQRFGEQWKPNN